MTPLVSPRAADSLKGMNRYTRRILLSRFIRNVAHSKNPKETGRPICEDGTILQYRIGSCRLICRLEEDSVILLAVTQGLPPKSLQRKATS